MFILSLPCWRQPHAPNGNKKTIYFVPFGQDAPEKKPNSMVARMELLEDTVLEALQGKQLQPVVVEKFRYMN